jgi:hypothetical protein
MLFKYRRRAPRSTKGVPPYPEPHSHLPRVQGIACRPERQAPWRVRLYSGAREVIFDQHFPTYDEAVATRTKVLHDRQVQEQMLYEQFVAQLNPICPSFGMVTSPAVPKPTD